INQGTQFTQCICNGGDGGAIYAKIEQNSSLEISEGVIFEQCETKQSTQSQKGGRGGAIYIDINFGSLVSFAIKDGLFSKCKATSLLTNTLSGFGGGIFIAGSGDYSVQSKRLDLKGMKIDLNTATQGGQTLYVVMNKLKEWCNYGIAGEYVKELYSNNVKQNKALNHKKEAAEELYILISTLE
ncbi:MAG: hypothetical protein EZS28_055825, partial [Streblomastix strix]